MNDVLKARARGVFLRLAVVWTLLAMGAANGQAQDKSVKITPINDVAKQLESALEAPRGPETSTPVATPPSGWPWKLQEQDEQPSVTVEGYRGYRIVLRRTWKEFTELDMQQQATARANESARRFELRHEDWEFVLVPMAPRVAPAALKAQVKWAKSNSPWYTRDLCLGQGLGYVWFAHGSLYWQELLREQLKLEGGDDRIQLMIDALQVEDMGHNTANSCLAIPARFGDRAIPYIEQKVAQAKPGEDLWRVVWCLAFIQTDRSTELLLKLFNSSQDEIHRAAQYGLINKPYRKSAKPAFLEMIRRRSSLDSACAACIEYQWKEAVPLLGEVIAHPQRLAEVRVAIPARRILEGRPIPQQILDAQRTLYGLSNPDRNAEAVQKIDAARELLIRTEDAEAANLAALTLSLSKLKGNNQEVNEAGREILKARPRESTVQFLKSLQGRLEKSEHAEIEALLTYVQS